MSESPTDYLRHIVEEAEFLLERSDGLSRQAFLDDPTLRRAFVRSLEVIGEAAKQLPLGWREENPGVDWRAMAGMRDRLIHGYFGVDYEIVWDVVATKLVGLHRELERLIDAEG